MLAAVVVEAVAVHHADSVPLAASLGVVLGGLIAHKRSGARSTASLQQRMGVTLQRSAEEPLRASHLRAAVSEADVLRVACDELHALCPGAIALAVAVVVDGEVVSLEVVAKEESARQGLFFSLPCTLQRGACLVDGSAVAFVCLDSSEHTRDVIIADSADWADGVDAFTDWAAATAGSCVAAQFITARLVSGTDTAGFIVLAFPKPSSFTEHAALRSYCKSVRPRGHRTCVAHACTRVLVMLLRVV
jgi:hypothetical protein